MHPIRRGDVTALLDLYGISDERTRDALIQLSEDVWRKGWWDDYASTVGRSGRVAVRHSHHPQDAVIVYTRAEWGSVHRGRPPRRVRLPRLTAPPPTDRPTQAR